MIAEGAPAPDFEAPDQDGRPFRLSSLRGSPVVLYFYPKADTPGCTLESKGFQAHLSKFAAGGVRVVGVSVDDCPAQKAFAEKYGLKFTLLADSKKEVGQKFGVLGPRGSARRVTFLIDRSGTVVEVVDSSSPDPHVERARARFLSA
jgi:thioredoxin-dependent peroxiredoxin